MIMFYPNIVILKTIISKYFIASYVDLFKYCKCVNKVDFLYKVVFGECM